MTHFLDLELEFPTGLAITGCSCESELLESSKAVRREKSEMKLKDVPQTKRRESVSTRIRKETACTKARKHQRKGKGGKTWKRMKGRQSENEARTKLLEVRPSEQRADIGEGDARQCQGTPEVDSHTELTQDTPPGV